MVELPVIDAHVHFWHPQRFPASWLEGDLNRPYEIASYFEQINQLNLAGFVYVEAGVEPHFALLEAQWAAALAQAEPRLRGIVAAAPLEYGSQARKYLEALVELGPIVKGVRRLLQAESDPAFCLQPTFVTGVQGLAEFDWSFDLCIKYYQLGEIIELVKKWPQTSFILDHLGKPNIRKAEVTLWRTQMQALAALPNVGCKISGLVTEADPQNWTEADLEPYVTTVLEVFGEDRVMFGSDWPVVLLASSYQRWADILANLTKDLSAEARRKLWAENAIRYYRL